MTISPEVRSGDEHASTLGALGFADDDAAARYYIDRLRDGTADEKIAARVGLARIFENRGMLLEATELYENNARAGVRDPALYQHLASLYRRQGRVNDESAARATAARLALAAAPVATEAALVVDPAEPRAAPAWLLLVGGIAAMVLGAVIAATTSPWGSGDTRASAPVAVAEQEPTAAPATPTEVPAPTIAAATVPFSAAGAGSNPKPVAPAPAESRPAAGPEDCVFILGFADLRTMVGPEAVGECIEDQSSADNGDARQRTTRGELVWRKASNTTAFTDGHTTWINGPNGLQSRSNDDRFAWEPPNLPPVLPGSLLPSRRIVSYYGNPLSAQMGILGELPPAEMIARLKQQAQEYAAADPSKPILPALELVATVAQAGAGADGLYRLRMDTELIEEIIDLAEKNNFIVILDIQIGRSNVATETRSMLKFLSRPNVHLALDPEFAMAPTEKPGEEIGSLDAADINVAIDMVAELVTAENLPPKLMLVHRFTERMITNYRKIKADSRVQVAVVMDGFGGPDLKIKHYNQFVRDQRVQYTGFKLFYKQDKPVMTPKQVVDLEPTPDVVIYQ